MERPNQDLVDQVRAAAEDLRAACHLPLQTIPAPRARQTFSCMASLTARLQELLDMLRPALQRSLAVYETYEDDGSDPSVNVMFADAELAKARRACADLQARFDLAAAFLFGQGIRDDRRHDASERAAVADPRDELQWRWVADDHEGYPEAIDGSDGERSGWGLVSGWRGRCTCGQWSGRRYDREHEHCVPFADPCEVKIPDSLRCPECVESAIYEEWMEHVREWRLHPQCAPPPPANF